MSIVDITDRLIDSDTLAQIAKCAGITLAQARVVCGLLANLSETQVRRITVTCQLERIRESQREARKGKR